MLVLRTPSAPLCCFLRVNTVAFASNCQWGNVCINEINRRFIHSWPLHSFIIKLWASCLRLVLLAAMCTFVRNQWIYSSPSPFIVAGFACFSLHILGFTVHLTIVHNMIPSQDSGPLGTELLIGEGRSNQCWCHGITPTTSGQNGTTQQ